MDQVRCGVGEVDVLGTFVVEVVVLACSRVDGRGSRDLDNGIVVHVIGSRT